MKVRVIQRFDGQMSKKLTEKEIEELRAKRERKFSKISRVEVIGPEKREYVRYFTDNEYMDHDIQDDDRTLKIFIANRYDDD